MSPRPRESGHDGWVSSSRTRPLTGSQLAVVIVAVLAVVAAVFAAVVVLPPAVREASPERPVRAYLQAVTAGDVARALRLGRITPADGDKLLTDAAYRAAAQRPSAFTVLDASSAGDSGTVRARITQGTGSYVASFEVERADDNPFAPWRLAKQQLPEITVSLEASVDLRVTVAGVALTASHGTVTQHVLPGAYRAALAGGGQVTGTPATALATFAAARPAPAVIRLTLADSGESAAREQVAEWIAQCAASSELRPDGCPFRAVPEESVTYTDGHWTIDGQPSVRVGEWSAQLAGWPVTTSSPGYITFTAHASKGGLSGTATTGSNPFSVAGTIVPDASGTVHFVPSANYSDTDTSGSLT
jgi:hypothetical protein